MSEKELNKKWLKDELKEFSYSNEFFDKILDLLSKQYINGLEQSKFEKNLLEQEKEELQEQLSNSHQIKTKQKEFIEWLEDKLSVLNNILDTEEDEDNRHHVLIRKTAFEEVLSKYKEIMGVKDE